MPEPQPIKATRVSIEEYASLFDAKAHCFGTTAFARLNSDKVDDVHYVAIGREGATPIAGIILGQSGGRLRAPFSAPFADLTFSHSEPPLFSTLTLIAKALAGYANSCNCSMAITLPPPPYRQSVAAKTEKAFTEAGFTIPPTDLNFHLPCAIAENYAAHLPANGRNKLNASLRKGLIFEPDASIRRAYAVIKANREHRGFPLRMTLQQVLDTSRIITVRCFMVTTPNGEDVASAIVYDVTPDASQVIYWGNTPTSNPLRPMNFLACCLLRHYASLGKRILDIGPSTENGVPNYGLCDFKESIGCVTSLKSTFSLALTAAKSAE